MNGRFVRMRRRLVAPLISGKERHEVYICQDEATSCSVSPAIKAVDKRPEVNFVYAIVDVASDGCQ